MDTKPNVYPFPAILREAADKKQAERRFTIKVYLIGYTSCTISVPRTFLSLYYVCNVTIGLAIYHYVRACEYCQKEVNGGNADSYVVVVGENLNKIT
jgi:hypothetical protein